MTIIDKSAAEFWWKKKLPHDVAYLYKNHSVDDWTYVTYAEIKAKKVAKQQSQLWRKRSHETIRPCTVWVFSHGYWPIGGYYTIIKTIDREYYLNFRGHGLWHSDSQLQCQVMEAIPLGLLPSPDNFYEWMRAFVKRFRNTKYYQGWKEQGLFKARCRIDEGGRLMDILPIT